MESMLIKAEERSLRNDPAKAEERSLRNDPTKAEERSLRNSSRSAGEDLWQALQEKDIGFSRQETIGRFMVDFACLEKKLVITLGSSDPFVTDLGQITRDRWLKGQGFTVLKFWDHDILMNCEGVLRIIQRLKAPAKNLTE